jgi:hypothetical protein
MITYRIDENGKAVDFNHTKKLLKDYLVLDKNRIPGDTSIYNEQRYNDAEKLKKQKLHCIQLRKDAEYHFTPNPRFKNGGDIEKWREYCEKLDTILESNILQSIPEKPFS